MVHCQDFFVQVHFELILNRTNDFRSSDKHYDTVNTIYLQVKNLLLFFSIFKHADLEINTSERMCTYIVIIKDPDISKKW